MSGFENYVRETAELELELKRKGVALNIDWNNSIQVRELAREALDYKPGISYAVHDHTDEATRVALFGIAQLMLKVMTESAEDHMLSHGGPAWKAFAKALWAELVIRGLTTRVGTGDDVASGQTAVQGV